MDVGSLQEVDDSLDNENSGTEALDLPDFVIEANRLARRRVALCSKQPKCKKCHTYQVQIIDVEKQEWKCRDCKTTFFTKYKIY